MGETVDLKPIKLEENHGFVSDCCRFQEGILTESNMKLKYGFADHVWERLGDDRALLEAVEDEKLRRVRTGQQKRERAQMLVVRAPEVMSKILLDDSQSARHRIDSAKALNDFAANPADNTPAASDRFIIRIDLSASSDGKPVIETYDKSIAIDVNDGSSSDPGGITPGNNKPDDSGPRPRGKLLAVTPDEPWGYDGG